MDSFDASTQLAWERERLRRIRGRDPHAFREIYEMYAPALYRQILLPKLGDPSAAEDLTAEVFRILWEKIGTYEDRGQSVWHWLVTVARNRIIDLYRREQKSRRLVDFEHLLDVLPPSADPLERTILESERRRLRASITEVLERINPRYARAIELRFFEHRSREEAAAALEVTLGTFDVVLLRALRAFRKEWERASRPSFEGMTRHDA